MTFKNRYNQTIFLMKKYICIFYIAYIAYMQIYIYSCLCSTGLTWGSSVASKAFSYIKDGHSVLNLITQGPLSIFHKEVSHLVVQGS